MHAHSTLTYKTGSDLHLHDKLHACSTVPGPLLNDEQQYQKKHEKIRNAKHSMAKFVTCLPLNIQMPNRFREHVNPQKLAQ
jgi:hypothetical protein